MSIFKNTEITNPLDAFGNIKAVGKTPQINLKSVYGVSVIRDITTNTGSGAITTVQGEYQLSTGTTSGSTSKLDSAERGRYLAGLIAEVGAGVRLTVDSFSNDEVAEWGYFDANNGFGFGLDSTGKYVFVIRSGTKTKTYQSNWNGDPLDGTGESGLTLDYTNGHIYQVDFSWYGYGSLVWIVTIPSAENEQQEVVIHRFAPEGENSVENPNLPIRISVDNGTTTNDVRAFVGGRQFAIFGTYLPSFRITGQYRIGQTVDTTFIPTVSFRKKSSFADASIRLQGFDINTDADLIYQIRIMDTADLTSPSFGAIADTPATETSLEVDTSATGYASSPDTVIYTGLVKSSGSGVSATGAVSQSALTLNVPEGKVISFAVRRVTGTGATVTSLLRLTEEW